MASTSTVSVILSTYNQPEWLEKVLWGYQAQSHRPDEIVIADDGSDPETKQLIDRLRDVLDVPLEHVWHEDRGFRKTTILNRAIEAADGDYLIFSDGDCIPRKDFVAQHVRHRRESTFLSGGYLKLPMEVSRSISLDDIRSGRAFELAWLRGHGVPLGRRLRRVAYPAWKARAADALTPTRASWNGHNASTWKKHLVATNGFDERLAYGGEDRELGERLVRMGLGSVQLRHRALCLHLDHARGYVSAEAKSFNREVRDYNARTNVTRTRFGMETSGAPCRELPVSLVVIAQNEERVIRRCLDSVPFAAEKLVVDGGSTDRTVEIAEEAGARVVHQPWLGYGQQRNFAATLARHPWILVLDADEWLSPELAREIEIALPALMESERPGMTLKRTYLLMGTPLRFYRPMVRERKERLYHIERGRWTEPAAHERLVLDGSPLVASGTLFHEFCLSPADHWQALVRYAELKARDSVSRGKWTPPWIVPFVYPVALAKKVLLGLAFLDGRRGMIVAHNEARYTALKRRIAVELQARAAASSER